MLRFLVVLALIEFIGLGTNPFAANERPHAGGASPSAARGDPTYDRCRTMPGAEVITREDIFKAGLVRLGEIFRLSDRWYAYTIDGYTWNAQVSGLSPASNPRWTIIIDGNPVELGLFGLTNLDVLPINMREIECIEMSSKPSVVAGALRQFGTIRIQTSTSNPGVTVDASVAAGNEVNDPGPFAYTPFSSTNIDRVGPIGTGAVEFRSGGLSARLAGKIDEFHATDRQVDQRAKQLFSIDSKPRIGVRAAAFTAAFDSQWGRQNVLAGHNETDDLIFFDSFGLEIPATRRLNYLGASGTVRFGRAEMLYRGSFHSHDLAHRQNAGNLALDFRRRAVSAGLETRIRSGPIELAGGGSFDLIDAYSTHALSDSRTIRTQVFGEIGGWYRERVRGTVNAAWIQIEDVATFALYQNVYISYLKDHWVGLSSSLARRTLRMDESLWRWTRLGYDLPTRPLGEDETPAGVIRDLTFDPEPHLGTVDLELGGQVFERLTYSVTGYYRRYVSDYLPLHDVSYRGETTGLLTDTRVQGYLSGEFVGFSCGLGVRHSRALSQQLTYVAEGVTSGDRAIGDVHARVPSQRLSYSVTFSPVDRFSLFARARYHVGTIWQEYRAAASASSGFYPAEISDAFLVDLAASKRFWKDHVQANLAIRNVLNESYRSHPAGAIFDMAFHFSVQASFNSSAIF